MTSSTPAVPFPTLAELQEHAVHRVHRDPALCLNELESQLAKVFDADEAASMMVPVRQALADEDYRTLHRLLNEVEPRLSWAGSAMAGPCVEILNAFGTAEPAV
jgi:hypothetical protein